MSALRCWERAARRSGECRDAGTDGMSAAACGCRPPTINIHRDVAPRCGLPWRAPVTDGGQNKPGTASAAGTDTVLCIPPDDVLASTEGQCFAIRRVIVT